MYVNKEGTIYLCCTFKPSERDGTWTVDCTFLEVEVILFQMMPSLSRKTKKESYIHIMIRKDAIGLWFLAPDYSWHYNYIYIYTVFPFSLLFFFILSFLLPYLSPSLLSETRRHAFIKYQSLCFPS